MQNNIHPKWYSEAVVTCACGNTFTTGDTQPTVQVDICYNCHPFFTGEIRFVDRQGRVDKFRMKQQNAGAVNRGGKKARAEKKSQEKVGKDTASFKDILQEQRKNV